MPLAILTSFDSRLVKLEKSILPLYNSTQTLTKRSNSECRVVAARVREILKTSDRYRERAAEDL